MVRTMWSWLKRHPQALMYVYITMALVLVLYLIQHNADEQRARDNKSTAEALQRDCIARQGGRQTLREVIIVATTPQGGGTRFDLTKVPGFDALSAEEQAFFRNISQATGAATAPPTPPVDSSGIPQPDPNNALQKSLLDKAPSLDCPAGPS